MRMESMECGQIGAQHLSPLTFAMALLYWLIQHWIDSLSSAEYRWWWPVQLLWRQHSGRSARRRGRRVFRLWAWRSDGTWGLLSWWWLLMQPLPPLNLLQPWCKSESAWQIPITPLSLLRLCAKVQVLSGKCECGPVENVVDAKKDLLPDSGAQLVWELHHLHDPA